MNTSRNYLGLKVMFMKHVALCILLILLYRYRCYYYYWYAWWFNVISSTYKMYFFIFKKNNYLLSSFYTLFFLNQTYVYLKTFIPNLPNVSGFTQPSQIQVLFWWTTRIAALYSLKNRRSNVHLPVCWKYAVIQDTLRAEDLLWWISHLICLKKIRVSKISNWVQLYK